MPKNAAQRAQVTVVMPWHMATAVEARSVHQRHVERTWWEEQQAWAHEAGPRVRRERLAQIRVERARLREQGVLLGSRDAIRSQRGRRGWR